VVSQLQAQINQSLIVWDGGDTFQPLLWNGPHQVAVASCISSATGIDRSAGRDFSDSPKRRSFLRGKDQRASDRKADADQAMPADAGAGLEHPALPLTKRDRVVEPLLQATLYRSRHDERRSLPRQLGQTRQQRAAEIRAFPIDQREESGAS